MGADTTEAFPKTVAQALAIEQERADQVVKKEKAVYYSYLERLADRIAQEILYKNMNQSG